MPVSLACSALPDGEAESLCLVATDLTARYAAEAERERTLDDPALRALFNDLRDQVRTMVLVHEKLYQSESLTHVDFAEYAESLLTYLWRAHGAAAAEIFLTAHADRATLDRAKRTEPFGYLLKPFEERELESHIEMALYKHQTERKLRESEARYRRLVETAHEGIWAIDTDGRTTFVNERMAGMLGYTPEETCARRSRSSMAMPGFCRIGSRRVTIVSSSSAPRPSSAASSAWT